MPQSTLLKKPKSSGLKKQPDIDIDVLSKDWLNVKNIEKFIKSTTLKLFKLLPTQKFIEDGICFGVAFSLCSNAQIKKINHQYRGINQPTDVLSFGNLDEKLIQKSGLKKALGSEKYIFLGDIVLAFEYISNEAVNQSKTFNNHLSHLILHGLLHLIGYDHEEEEMAKIMENTEINILKKLNIDNPYNHAKS